jgi:hypothetical protein
MKRTSVFIAGLCSLLAPLPAFAATVQTLAGSVYIDRGSGYTNVGGSTSAKPGDLVMAKAGGRGEILYDDGCRQAVDVGAVVMVGAASPCQSGLGPVDHDYILAGMAIAAGVGIAAVLSNDDDKSASAK